MERRRGRRGETEETMVPSMEVKRQEGIFVCIFNPSVLWTAPYILLRDTAGGERDNHGNDVTLGAFMCLSCLASL